jgi:3-ketosteroid 9alpha-monooxygenase subunit A
MSHLEPMPMKYRAPAQGFPKGWYCVAEAAQVNAETLTAVSWLGEQLIAYRTPDGAAQVADAYCPHMGAHLASHDGCIRDGVVICPFHKWNFDAASGDCVRIPYSELPPAKVGLKLFPTREVDGMVLMWYHPRGAAPEFEPYLSPLTQRDKWALYTVKEWTTTCPFRDILENLFDTAHIVQLHNAAEMPAVKAVQRRDYGLCIDYETDPANSDMALKQFQCNFGGISLLTQHWEGQQFEALFIHSFTPIDDERFVQKTRFYIKDSGSQALIDTVGKAFTDRFVFEVEQDLRVLNFKKHLPQPRLCAGDGPIHQFRKYAGEFYV